VPANTFVTLPDFKVERIFTVPKATLGSWVSLTADDKGRLMVAICHNMDLGDSWEHADNPEYPEKFSSLGIRLGVNYVIYSMTH
jgi:chemotaxis receptor (MCP) glutamine deamidase CheD